MAVTKISVTNFGHWHSIVWIGALVLFSAAALFSDLEKTPLFVIVAAIALAISLAVKLRGWSWRLADEVYDGENHLVVRRRGEEEIVPFSNIMSVVYTNRWRFRGSGPERITLSLARAGKFGSEIAFRPKKTDIDDDPSTCIVADNLNRRVKRARPRGAA